MIGTKLAHYGITAHLGSGGMGDVYQATDLKLKRSVAIKLLPAEFASDSDRLARFRREAQLLASLNHPNIAHIYGLEESGDKRCIVMELVDGETLQARLKRGPIPVDEALAIAKQLCEALEAANEKGVIHRDLKPGNVMLTLDGKVKVLDFGLAKAFQETEETDLSNSPTLMSAASVPGVILGTAAYMSPEQARGRKVDKRTDIFAFGCVLYEMVTGIQAFDGEDVSEILARVLEREPDWTLLPANVPPRIRELLRLCMEKSPKSRRQDARDVLIDIEQTATALETFTEPAVPLWSGRPIMVFAVLIAMFVLVGAAALIGWLRPVPKPAGALNLAFTITPRTGTALLPPGINAPEISPDGSAVLYRASDGWNFRRLDALQPLLLRGLGSDQFWSPDSKSIAFVANHQLVKMRVPDGAPDTITPVEGFTRGGSWSEKGDILISISSGRTIRLYQVRSTGGALRPVDVLGIKSGRYYNPEFLPGSEDFLFFLMPDEPTADGEGEIYQATLRDGKATNPVLLRRNATSARYTEAGGGRILFVRDDNLYSQTLNLPARKLEGEPQLIEQSVASSGGDYREGDFSVSADGVLAFRTGRVALAQVTTFDRQGNEIGTSGPPGPIGRVALSPDEKQLLATVADGTWLLDSDQPSHLSLDDGNWRWSVWSPDGSKVLGQERSSRGAIGERSITSSGVRELGSSIHQFHDVSPDGKDALLQGNSCAGVFSLPLEGAAPQLRTLVATNAGGCTPRFSPDGRWFVYSVSGQGIFAQPFPGPGLRKQVAPTGTNPVWRKDGKEIIYLDGDAVWSVNVESARDGLSFSSPQKLFSGFRLPSYTGASHLLEISANGSRIFFIPGVEQPDSSVINIRIGWFNSEARPN